MKRRLNTLAVLILLATASAASAAVYFVHDAQIRGNISVLLDRSSRAEKDGDLREAQESLRRYLFYRREDAPTWKRYAELMDRINPSGQRRGQVFLAYEQALRLDPGNQAIRRRSADLALFLGRFTEARRHYSALIEALPKGESKRVSHAELKDRLGQCDEGQSKSGEAESLYREAISDDPTSVETYNRLARLLRTERKQPEAADQMIDSMVAANPTSGRAHYLRWEYQREFGAAANPGDARKAFELAPKDLDAILAAATVAEEEGDAESARALLTLGQTEGPDRAIFPIRLARLEQTANRAEEAGKILQAAQARLPGNVEIAFLLADSLITRGKIDGKGEARDWLIKLREMGLQDGFSKYLEGRLAILKQDWEAAISRLNAARSSMARDSALVNQLNLMLAQCYQSVKDTPKAIDALERITPDGTNSDQSRAILADLYLANDQLEKALTVHLGLAKSRPESRLDIARIFLISELAKPEGQRNWTEVETRLTEAEQALPTGSLEVGLVRADLLAAQGKLAAARTLIETLAQANPKDLRARLAQIRAAQTPEDASRLLDQAEKDLGSSVDLALARLNLELQPGGQLALQAILDLDGARPKFKPDDQPGLLQALAIASYRLGERDRAAGYWKELLKVQPTNATVVSLLIDVSLETAKVEQVPALIDRLKLLDGMEGIRWRQADAVFRLDLIRRLQAKEASNVLRIASEIEDRAPDSWIPSALRGQLAESQGQPDQAIVSYRDAIERGCTQPGLARQLVALLYQRQAFAEIDQVLATLRGNGAEPADLTLVEAMNQLRRGRVDEAIGLARRTLPESSPNAQDHIFIGRMLVYAGRYAEAEPSLARALELTPGSPEALISYVECLARMDQGDRARELLARTTPALPADRADQTLAICNDLLGDIDAASKSHDSALARKPNDPTTIRSVLDFAVRRGQADRAKALLATLEALEGADVDRAWINRIRSQMLLQSGDLAQVDEAIALVERNLEESPLSYDDQKLRAILLSMRPSKRKESIEQLEKLNASGALEPQEQFLLAMLYGTGGDWNSARDLLARIVDNPISKKDPRPLYYFTSLLLDHDELAEAGRRLEQLRPLLPDSPQLLSLESRLLVETKRQSEAVGLLRGYSEKHPDQIGVLASLYDQLGFVTEAEKAYRDFVAQDPQQPERVLGLISFLGLRGKTDEALELCRQVGPKLPPEAISEANVGVITAAPKPTEAQVRQVEERILQLLQATPDSGALLVQLAVLRAFEEKFEEAESRYREALSHDARNLQALNNLSWLLGFRHPEGSEALELIDKAIELAGPAPALLDTRAVLRVMKGQVQPALDDLRVALSNAPEIPVLYLHLALAQHKAGNLEEAREAFAMAEERGLKAESVDPLERAEYARLRADLMP